MSESPSISNAWQLRSQCCWAEAEQECRAILAYNPGDGQAWHLLGLLAHDQGQHAIAVEQFEQAITAEPDQPLHYNNLGVVFNSWGHYEKAAACFEKALSLDSNYLDARSNLGLAFYYQNRFNEADQCFTDILSVDPKYVIALANLGMTQLAQQKYAEAVKTYEKAIGLGVEQPNWYGNLGAAHNGLGDFQKSARYFHQASQLAPDNLDYSISRAIALRAFGDLAESIRILEEVVSKDPGNASAIANLVVGLEYTCQWNKLDMYHPMLDQATQKALTKGLRPDEDPMLNIRRCDDVALNQAVSRAWSQDIQSKANHIGKPFSHGNRPRRHNCITLGYLSNDFRNHPVTHQIFPLFRMHDRNRFRVVAFSTGPNDGSTFRREVEAGCDEFVDISAHGMADAAQTIYNHQVDILIDLMGHSHHNRMGVFALRPAPLQVSYLGFLSTTGADFIDYIVADPVVVPKDLNHLYDEKILRMPDCYQLNHKFLIGKTTDSHRKDWGLPSSGFVFSCFNNAYKIDRDLFDTWMRILQRTPGSVLWLSGGHQVASDHMRSRAEMLGIDRHRLVFAKKIPLEDHLKRMSLADLTLDTIRYNGGATTANALAIDLPVITVQGRHWVSRMSASHLIAAGLPDLVFKTLTDYEEAAIELASHPEMLHSIRQRLVKNAKTLNLFDPQTFVHHLETGFEAIWDRYLNALPPDHVDLPIDLSRSYQTGHCQEY